MYDIYQYNKKGPQSSLDPMKVGIVLLLPQSHAVFYQVWEFDTNPVNDTI